MRQQQVSREARLRVHFECSGALLVLVVLAFLGRQWQVR
jgi:hypothetical protein